MVCFKDVVEIDEDKHSAGAQEHSGLTDGTGDDQMFATVCIIT